jgi:DnaJ like chaperone protein
MIGRIIGAYFGFSLTSPLGHGFLGIIVGWWIGSQFDNSIKPKRRNSFYFNFSHTPGQRLFFNSTFAVMGHVAKSDGVVSQQEIRVAESFMGQLGLSGIARKEAIASFNRGKDSSFNLDQELEQILMNYRGQLIMLRMFIDVQYKAASVDGLSEDKVNLLNHICQRLGFSSSYGSDYSRVNSFQQETGDLSAAYKLLGVPETCTDQELKKSYRKMLGKHHPDRLLAKGLPPEMIKVANEKTIEIKKAYELICRSR